MKHSFEQKVYFADTDNYGVVWHGTYLRWMEIGRIEYCHSLLNMGLKELEDKNILLPVSNINIKYKSSAKLEDIVVIETEVIDYNGLTATFKQTIKSKESGKIYTEAQVIIVAVDKNAKLYRRMPDILANAFQEVLS